MCTIFVGCLTIIPMAWCFQSQLWTARKYLMCFVWREKSRPYTVAGGRGYNQQVPFHTGQNGACSVNLLWISCGVFSLWITIAEGEKPGDPGMLSAFGNVKEKFVCIKETKRGKCHWSPLLGSHPSYPYVTLQKYWAYFPFSHLSSFFNLYFSPFQIWPLIANFLIFSMKV